MNGPDNFQASSAPVQQDTTVPTNISPRPAFHAVIQGGDPGFMLR